MSGAGAEAPALYELQPKAAGGCSTALGHPPPPAPPTPSPPHPAPKLPSMQPLVPRIDGRQLTPHEFAAGALAALAARCAEFSSQPRQGGALSSSRVSPWARAHRLVVVAAAAAAVMVAAVMVAIQSLPS